MKIVFLTVGTTTNKQLLSLIYDYCSRLGHYATFSMHCLPELKNTKKMTEEQQKQAEGKMILSSIGEHADMVLLDEHGEQMRSTDFARYIQKRMLSGRELVFVSGGPYGFSSEVYQRANGKISLSLMTFSHQMVRLFFVEQLYRAFTILNHEPYHHE
ncbi:MAG: 23S rRNA (pseudouridine(1915)-N(3))-methyltransferase RlmH [Paludibacteraceae bacterium]|nr:23S rRNA (pseudouridine(1915)-N(3))-methyltransferase RlmH [Paludibacteraceae bacterium]